MENTERAGNGEAGSRSGIESAERGPAATSEEIQAESVRGTEPGLAAGLGMKPQRVVFPIAGKGGVGKTTVMATLAEWYAVRHTRQIVNMDPDNKAEGSFRALFARAHKLPGAQSWTYDKLLGVSLESSADVILADSGAAQGHRMIPWFREFYRTMQESGLQLRWTALGVVDGDIASARSVIEWGEELQNTVDYVIVHNYYQGGVPSAWENPKIADDVAAFREVFSPVEIRIDARRPDLQRMMRTMNVTLSDVGERRTTVPELRAPDMTLRARTYRFRAFSQFTEARKVLLP